MLALSNALEEDEDESTIGVGNGGVSVAKAGWEEGGWGVWVRDDMDGVERWDATDVSFLQHFAVSMLKCHLEFISSPYHVFRHFGLVHLSLQTGLPSTVHS